jgi:hypothetical protein
MGSAWGRAFALATWLGWPPRRDSGALVNSPGGYCQRLFLKIVNLPLVAHRPVAEDVPDVLVPRPAQVCPHIHAGELHYHAWFHGRGVDHACVCAACAAAFPAPPTWCETDEAWWAAADLYYAGHVGAPEVRTRDAGLRFEHVDVPWPSSIDLVDVAPLPGTRPRWLGLTRDGALVDLDATTGVVSARRPLTLAFPITDESALLIGPSGTRVVAYEQSGSHGALLDVATGGVVCALDRGDDRPANSCFPVALTSRAGRELLIVGSDSNRVELLDAERGTNLADRPIASFGHPHNLDYFYGGLAASPAGSMVATAGWRWHPVGVVRTWSIDAWLTDPWVSEDVPRAQEGPFRFSWDEPMCWLDERYLATWGWSGCESESPMLDGVTIFDAHGDEHRWFAGVHVRHHGVWPPRRPADALIYDGYLIAIDDAQGTSVWDVSTGERLLHDPALAPRRYHRGAHALRAWDATGLRLTTIVEP